MVYLDEGDWGVLRARNPHCNPSPVTPDTSIRDERWGINSSGTDWVGGADRMVVWSC